MSDRVDAIRDRMSAATPGPWDWEYNDGTEETVLISDDGDTVLEPCVNEDGDVVIRIKRADADFIAYARQDIEYLIGKVDCLTAMCDKFYEDMDAEITAYMSSVIKGNQRVGNRRV